MTTKEEAQKACRAAFEKWFKEYYHAAADLRTCGDSYLNHHTRSDYAAWQIAWNAAKIEAPAEEWIIDNYGCIVTVERCEIEPTNPKRCIVSDTISKEDAELIVKAVNAYLAATKRGCECDCRKKEGV